MSLTLEETKNKIRLEYKSRGEYRVFLYHDRFYEYNVVKKIIKRVMVWKFNGEYKIVLSSNVPQSLYEKIIAKLSRI